MDFFAEDVEFLPENQESLSLWVSNIIEAEGKIPAAISFIFCSDEYLLQMNIDHLGHDYYTDIITFDYCEGPVVSGDLFISVGRVRENAAGLEVTFTDELHRVMIHGVLHLLGYGDKTDEDAQHMRAMEDKCLALL